MAVIQAHILFKGHVQGVGFRFTVLRVAREFAVNGWIKNCVNGDVEALLQADKEKIDAFLKRIRAIFSRYIVDEEIEISEPAKKLNSFEIRF